MLSDLFPNAREHLGLRQLFDALMLLGEDGKHLCLDSFHLVIELLEACHLAPILMYFGLQRAIVHFDQCCVDVEGLMPRR